MMMDTNKSPMEPNKELTFEGHLYHPASTKSRVSKNEAYSWISLALLILCAAILYIFGEQIENATLRNSIIFLFLGLIGWHFVVKLKLIGTKDVIHGKLQGVIRITPTEIYLKKAQYPLAEISALNFRVSDYADRVKVNTTEMDPMRSNGTGNYLSFSYRDTLYEVQFLIQVKSQLEDLRALQSIIAERWPNTGLAPPRPAPKFFDLEL